MSSSGEDVRRLLAESWRDGRLNAFCDTVLHRAADPLTRAAKSRGLTAEEAEDALASALETLLSRYEELRPRVREPYGYLHTVVKHEAEDIRREREHRAVTTAEFAREGAADGVPGAPSLRPEWAHLVISELADVETDDHWAVQVVAVAAARLPPGERAVIEHLASQELDRTTGDFAYSSASAGEALGISPGAVRARKKRAYGRLKVILPELIRELGVDIPVVAISAVFKDEPVIPSEE